MVYKPTYNWGAPSCIILQVSFIFFSPDGRYTAATASRQAAGEALKQTVDLAEEHSYIEAEESAEMFCEAPVI